MNNDEIMNKEELQRNLDRLPGWTHESDMLRTTISCKGAQQAIDLFSVIAQLAQEANHHPDVDWRYNKLMIALTSHDAGSKVTVRDIALAQQISKAVDKAGANLA